MNAPPTIFSPARRLAIRRRMRALQAARPDPARYIMHDMIEDVFERLQFLRHEPRRVLAIGDWSGERAEGFAGQDCSVTHAHPEDGFAEDAPFPFGGFDFIASLGTLDTINDLPGALIHLRNALAPGGLMIASFLAAGSLPRLRAAMLAADGERPAARFHPMVDVRAGGQLLQRCGFAQPVVDSRGLEVRYSSFARLLGDLREQGLTCSLASPAPRLTPAMRSVAEAHFMGGEARVSEQFEILTLSGWKL